MLLLLKSSDRVAHDICHAFDDCEAAPSRAVQHTLALRKWIALRPERELRCFVRQHELIGEDAHCTIVLRPVVEARSCDRMDSCQAALFSLCNRRLVCLTAILGPVHAHLAGCAIRRRTLSHICAHSSRDSFRCAKLVDYAHCGCFETTFTDVDHCAVQQYPSAISWRAPTSCTHRRRS